LIKVIIIDDESRICSLIKILGKWDEMGMTVVGTAGNGEQALELIRAHQPHIIITDIKIPIMDGLEVIKQTKYERIPAHFIIISGYQEFEDAHRALQYGVENYLLKPINEMSLNDTLRKIQTKILNEANAKQIMSTVKHEAIHNRKLIQSQLIQQMVEVPNLFPNSFEVIESVVKYLYHPAYFGVVFTIDLMNTPNKKLEKDLRNEIVKDMNCFFSDDFACYSNWNMLFCLVNAEIDDYERIKSSLEEILNSLNNKLIRLWRVTCGISMGHKALRSDIMQEAIVASRFRLTSASGTLFEFINIQKEGAGFGAQLIADTKHALSTAYTQGIVIAMDREINGTCVQHINPNKCFKELLELGEYLIELLTDKLAVNELEAIRRRYEHNLFRARNVQELLETAKLTLIQELKSTQTSQSQEAQEYIFSIKQHIDLNFSKPIVLKDVADLVHLSPEYLSSLFKKETGMNFKDYLIQVRIDKAKVLLKARPHLSISEICSAVGYPDQAYFSKMFKRVVGLSPSQYRKVFS